MSIWYGEPSLDWANSRRDGTLLDVLGIEMTELTEDSLKGRMPVDGRTRQPGGVLHGGASVAFAESLASWGSTFTVDPATSYCVGMEINANHTPPGGRGLGLRRGEAAQPRPHHAGVGDQDHGCRGQARVHLAVHDGRAREAVRVLKPLGVLRHVTRCANIVDP